MSVRASVPDPPEVSHRLWRGFRGAVGWDVGANCGQTALEMAFEFGRTTCFEPDPRSFVEARRVIRLHRLHAGIMNIALSDRDGEITLAYPAQEQKETGQLVTVGLQGMEWEPVDWAAAETVTVPCRRADSLAGDLGAPDFIKVDTEGHEVHVLRGAEALLKAGGTDWLVEFHSPGNHAECAGILRAAGCTLEVVRHPHYPEESHMWRQHGWIRAFASG